jgi:hypothetical protein
MQSTKIEMAGHEPRKTPDPAVGLIMHYSLAFFS